MIFLYTLVLLASAAVKLLITRRAASLERKYSTVAGKVLTLATDAAWKPGNGNRGDVCASAKRAYELGMLVQKRDRLEGKCLSWRAWADRLGRLVALLRTWKGMKLPYTMGALDIWLVLYLIDRFGAGEYFGLRQLLDTVLAWLKW